MRKYQQLLLVLISLISIGVLIVYRSENERLNNVLEVVNFFGGQQKNSLNLVLAKIENFSNFTYNFDYPLPSWSFLGNEIFAYSAFWKRNELKPGGEAVAIAIGGIHSTVSFQCKIHFTDNTIGNGKFGFMRVESEISDSNGTGEKFLIYKFICKTQQDSPDPKNLIFINTQFKSEHFLPIRHLSIKNRANMQKKALITICLDLNSYNRTFLNDFNSDTNLAQYFLHHELIGINTFIVYNNNANQLNQHLIDLLTRKYGIKLNILPYNFPFSLQKEKNRAIIESDCLMRTSGLSKYVMITNLNEYLYPSSKITSQSNLIKLFNRSSNEVNRFVVKTKSVCLNERIKILSDNEKYNPEKSVDFFIDKNDFPYNNKEINDIGKKSMDIETDIVVVHKYIKCQTTSEQNLYKWRTTMKKEHEEYINFISRELNKLLFM